MKFEKIKRKNDRLAIVGFAPSTRDLVPWDDKTVDVMGLNEGYVFPWMKRWDYWMQIHPLWDLKRSNNQNDPNHYHWLTKADGVPCQACKATGSVFPLMSKGKDAIECPSCNGTGAYILPESRKDDFPIFMQKAHTNIPNSVRFPLEEWAKLVFPEENKDKLYFSSSMSYMLGVGVLLGYPQIELYGFDMGALTEYMYQRANAEYLIGLCQGRGIKVILPRESTLLTGPLYAYKNMQIGFRQNLELRKKFLEAQKTNETNETNQRIGKVLALRGLTQTEEVVRELEAATVAEQQQKVLVNGLMYAIKEVELMTKLYDTYFWTGTDKGEEDEDAVAPGPSPDDLNLFITTAYKAG